MILNEVIKMSRKRPSRFFEEELSRRDNPGGAMQSIAQQYCTYDNHYTNRHIEDCLIVLYQSLCHY